MQKVLTLRLVVKDDGTVALDRAAKAVDRLERETNQASAATHRLANAQTASLGSMRNLVGIIGGLVGAGALGMLVRETYQYNQQLESTKIGIAGLLTANREYLGTQDQWGAALAESSDLLRQIQVESLKTKATVPQLGDAFATTFGAATAAGLRATNAEILLMTTRITQVGNAFNVPMEQMRQEINSLLTGQITQDSLIAKRLGFDNESVKTMVANGTIIAEIVRRTEAYAKAAEAQSDTLSGKLLNTREIIVATFSRGMDGALKNLQGLLDSTFGWFVKNGSAVESAIQRGAASIEAIVGKTIGWVKANKELVTDVTATVAIIGGLAVAISVLASPITWTIAAVVALGVAWHEVSELSEMTVGGRPVAAYMRATWEAAFAIVKTSVLNQIGIVKGLYDTVSQGATVIGASVRLVGALISSFGQTIVAGVRFMTTPFRVATELIASTVRVAEGSATAVKGIAQAIGAAIGTIFGPLVATVGAVASGVLKIGEVMVSGIENIFGRVVRLFASLSDAAVKYVPGAAEARDAARELVRAFENFKPIENMTSALADSRKAAEEGMADFRAALNSTEKITGPSDLLRDAMGRVRAMMPDLKKVGAEAAAALFPSQDKAGAGGEAASDYNPDKFRASIDKLFNREAFEKNLNSRGFRNGIVSEFVESSLDMQRQAEAGRLEIIEDSNRRELETRLAANRKWLEEEKENIREKYGDHQALLEQADKAKEEMDARDRARYRATSDEQKRIQREQLVGTKEWAAKLAKSIGSVADQVTRMFGESRLAIAGFFDGLLSDLAAGQADFGKSIEDLAKNLGQVWTRMLSDMLTKTIGNGDSIVTQLKGLWEKVGAGQGPLDAGIAGAGVGGMVGGIFQTENNYAGVGGMVGGGIGAGIGYYLGGAVGAKIGMMIGTALGTAIGSVITKGKDHINVAINEGVVSVVEKGISGKAAADLKTQIQRQLKEQMKGWQSILDLFPQHVKDALAKIVPPKVNLTGGVEDADISDTGALGALGDFLANDLPKATFDAYRNSLLLALKTMGVQRDRIADLLNYWGTLQGKELQEAVRRYVVVLIDAVDIHNLVGASFDDKREVARKRSSATPLTAIDDIGAQIATIVASATKLTDVEDIIAAQEQVNQLERQRYEMVISYLQRIDAIQKQITESIAAQKEQIQLAGMDDQQKIDFFYDRMATLRAQLGAATDPEEIARLTQQIQSYVQQALGLAPGNKENRDKLLKILDEVGGVSNERLETARKEVEEREKKAIEISQKMLDALLGIKDAITKKIPLPVDPPGTGDKPGGDDPTVPNDPRKWRARHLDAGSVVDEVQAELLQLQLAELEKMSLKQPTADAIGAALVKALEGARFQVEDPITIDNGDLGPALTNNIKRELILTFQSNPDMLTPRT